MLNVSRIGDQAVGICNFGIPHIIICTCISASPLTTTDGLGVARVGDLYTTTCSIHNPIAVSTVGSPITTDLSLNIARVGDITTHAFGTACLIQGSPITLSD